MTLSSDAVRLIPRTKEQIAYQAIGLAKVQFLSLEKVNTPGSSRHAATAEEAMRSLENPNRDPAKPPIKEGDIIGAFGLPSSVYRAQVDWVTGDSEQLSISILGGRVDDVWIDFDGQPHPLPGRTYVMFLYKTTGGYAPIGPQFELGETDILTPLHDAERGVGEEFAGASFASLRAEFSGLAFANAQRLVP